MLKLKGYLRYKSIFDIKKPLMCNEWLFFLDRKCFVLEKSRFLCFCEIHKFHLWRHHRHCYMMKFAQILVYLIKSIYNMFLAQYWRLKTSSRPFQDFNKMTIKLDLSIFSSWYLPLLILPYSPFRKNERLELI